MAVVLSACAPDKTSGTKMAEANQLYEAGQYQEAASVYQLMVDAGTNDEALYYNLGNAYYKSGDLGRAILNYRRAQIIDPRDSDVETNLQIAREQTIDQLETADDSFADSIRELMVEWTTLNEAAVIVLCIWLLLCAMIIAFVLWQIRRRILLYSTILVAVIFLISVVILGIRISNSQDDDAVVVASSVETRSGPGEDYLTEFTLHAGAEVSTLEQREGWVRISLPGNLQGWLPADTIEEL